MKMYFGLKSFDVLLLFSECLLWGGHSFDKFSDFEMMFVSGSGERSEEEFFEYHSFNYKNNDGLIKY